jgi:hypothetical protein
MFRENYMEVCLKTKDAVQHLKLQGFLKRSDILIRSEFIHNRDEQFGMFMVVVDGKGLALLKQHEDLFDKIDVLEDDSIRWNTYKEEKPKANNDIQLIKDFLFGFTVDEDDNGNLEGMLDVVRLI